MTTSAATRLTPLVTSDLLRRLEALSSVPGDRTRIDVTAPFTGDVIGSVPSATEEDVVAAVGRARVAAAEWCKLPVAARARVLDRFHDLIVDNAALAMDIVQLESGKSRMAAMEEVYHVAVVARYYRNVGPGLLKPRRLAVAIPGLTRAREYRHPKGVVGFISPWNFPFTLAISDMLPALLAGNGAVLKPDEKTPYSALFAVSLLREAGLPTGVVEVVTGVGEEVGGPLVDAVDFVMFTGSTEVGRAVAERAGRNLIGASMELGGKNAALVLDDVDMDRSIPEIARAVFANSGQLCFAMERVYVDRSVLNEFTERFVRHVGSLKMATAFDYSGELSSLIDEGLVDKVEEHLEDAVGKGARVLIGGRRRPDIGPTFFEATVVTGVDESMTMCRSETFGPLVTIYPVDGVDEAVRRANDSDLGLNFSVWTGDEGRGYDVARRLQAGTVGINDGYAASWATVDGPLGGWKASGIARRHGPEGILKYTEPQTIVSQRWLPAFAPSSGMSYATYDRFLARLLRIVKHLPFYK
jgi:succinate-semialdehyde dehydrogenase/glutarate-semialdehyde dehydrogenase